MSNPSAVNAETGLYRTGEYYLKTRMYSQARYVFSRYMTYYPSGKMAEQAGRYLESAEAALSRYGDGKGPAPVLSSSGTTTKDFAAASPAPVFNTVAEPTTATASEGASLSDVAKDYYNAVSLFSQEKYKEALSAFKTIVESGDSSEYLAKAQFDMGRCLFALGQWDLSIKHFTSIIQSYPKHPDMADMLYIMGQSWDKKGDQAKAKAFYNKVLTMTADDDSSARIKAKKAINALGGA